MLKELIQNQRKYLNTYFDQLDLNEAEKFLEALRGCQGVIVCTGVGKSGLIAEKVAMTLTSTGTRAIFLSPTNALHGDVGIVDAKDCVMLFSKSGESDELLALIPALRNRGVKIFSILSNLNSRLAKSSDYVIFLPLEKELCPYDMVPTISGEIQMLFGDVLAIELMHQSGFSLEQYAKNHPAGRIGKRIVLKVSDLMIRGKALPTCSPEDILTDVLVELSNKRCGCVLVISPDFHLEGIFTDGDLLRSLKNHGTQAMSFPMKQLMTKSARSIGPSQLAWDAMKEMEGDQKNAITVLPVLDDSQKVLGLIRLHDIIQSGL